MRGPLGKVVERSNAGDGWSEGRRNGWVARVGPVFLRIYRVFVNRGVECGLHLRGVAGELNDVVAVRDIVNLKAVRLQPRSYFLDVRLGGAKLSAEFLGREPLVKIG